MGARTPGKASRRSACALGWHGNSSCEPSRDSYLPVLEEGTCLHHGVLRWRTRKGCELSKTSDPTVGGVNRGHGCVETIQSPGGFRRVLLQFYHEERARAAPPAGHELKTIQPISVVDYYIMNEQDDVTCRVAVMQPLRRDGRRGSGAESCAPEYRNQSL